MFDIENGGSDDEEEISSLAEGIKLQLESENPPDVVFPKSDLVNDKTVPDILQKLGNGVKAEETILPSGVSKSGEQMTSPAIRFVKTEPKK